MATRDVLAALTATVAGVPGLVDVFDGIPEAAPRDAQLPCAMVAYRPGELRVATTDGVIVTHRFDVEILVARLANWQAESAAAEALMDAVSAALLGNVQVTADAILTGFGAYDVSPVQQWQNTYAGARLGLIVEEFRVVSFA